MTGELWKMSQSIVALMDAIERDVELAIEPTAFEDLADKVAEDHGVTTGDLMGAYAAFMAGDD